MMDDPQPTINTSLDGEAAAPDQTELEAKEEDWEMEDLTAEMKEAYLSKPLSYVPLIGTDNDLVLPPRVTSVEFISMEYGFLMSAQESIISQFKQNKRLIEKEIATILSSAKKLKRATKDKTDEALTSIDTLIGKIGNLRTEYQKVCRLESAFITCMTSRLDHLKNIREVQVSLQNMPQGSLSDEKEMLQYFETRLNRCILDWMLHNKMFKTAYKFQTETGIEAFSNLHLFYSIYQVYDTLSEVTDGLGPVDLKITKALGCALAWQNVHKTKLQNIESQLELHLRLQEFTQMIRKNQVAEATLYAQTHFSKFFTMSSRKAATKAENERTVLIQKAMGLLSIFPEKRHKFESYNYFVNRQRWVDIQELFLKESFQLFHLSRVPLLENAIQVGLTSMNTVICCQKQEKNEVSALGLKHHANECPTCNMKGLAHRLKLALKTQTSMKCKVTGRIMDHNDHPIWIPLQGEEAGTRPGDRQKKGYLICKSIFQTLETKEVQRKAVYEKDPSGDQLITCIECPLTGKPVEKEKCRKVFFC